MPGILFTGGMLTDSELEIIKSGLKLVDVKELINLFKLNIFLIQLVNKDGYINSIENLDLPIIGSVCRKLWIDFAEAIQYMIE